MRDIRKRASIFAELVGGRDARCVLGDDGDEFSKDQILESDTGTRGKSCHNSNRLQRVLECAGILEDTL